MPRHSMLEGLRTDLFGHVSHLTTILNIDTCSQRTYKLYIGISSTRIEIKIMCRRLLASKERRDPDGLQHTTPPMLRHLSLYLHFSTVLALRSWIL